jgi:acyl carrier protein phosphodiesterase
MNYLAHAYLSFNDPHILVGNMTSDFIKGKKKYNYPLPILYGINLHRSIDEYTDNHPVTKDAKKIFQEQYGLYAGAFMDIVYDYYLANDSGLFKKGELETFSINVYDTLESHIEILPERFRLMFPYMKEHNWLLNYKTTTGIKRSFEGLAHRANYMSDSKAAYESFLQHDQHLRSAYNEFFPDLVKFTRQLIQHKRL